MDRGRDWRKRARRVAFRINAAAWLGRFVPLVAGLSLLGTIAILLSRRLGADERPVWALLASGLIVAGAVALRLGRPAFFSVGDALVHLDIVHGLQSRLTSAFQEVGAWPPAPQRATDGLAWRWGRIAVPLAFSAALLGAAHRIPVPEAGASGPGAAPGEPLAWQRIASVLETLRKEPVVAETALDGWSEKLDHLRNEPRDSWYSHGSLEAGDSLRDQLEDGLRSLERDLGRTDRALDRMGALDESARAEDWDRIERDLDSAISGLEMGTLPLRGDLLRDLEGLDPGRLRRLSPRELEELRKRLGKGLEACRLGLGPADPDEDAWLLLSMAGGAGQGGVSRGPGVAPMWLDPEATDLGSRRIEQVSNEDLSHAALGELIGVQRGAHRVTPRADHGPAAGGAIRSAGAGGETVWRTTLMPQDQKVLRRYFQ